MLNQRTAGLLFIFLAIGHLYVYAQEDMARHIEVPVGQPGFDPAHAKDTTLSFEDLVATFKASAPMAVILESPGHRKTVSLPVEFSQLSSARLYQSDRLVITGMATGDVSEVVIVDPEKASVVDHFLCYDPAISPDGRYVVFVKFYPAHGVDSAEDHYMLYDVHLNSEQNRPAGLAPHLNLYLAGKVLYPPGMSNRLDDNINTGNPSDHMMASDGFFWNDQSNTVVFADRFRDEYSLIIGRIANGAFSSDPVSVPKQLICPADGSCDEHLASAEFSTSPTPGVIAIFRGVHGTAAKEMKVVVSRNEAGNLVAVPAKR